MNVDLVLGLLCWACSSASWVALAAATAPAAHDLSPTAYNGVDIDALLANMTIRQKAAQMTQMDIYSMMNGDERDPKKALKREVVARYARTGVGSILNSPFAGGPVGGRTGWSASDWREGSSDSTLFPNGVTLKEAVQAKASSSGGQIKVTHLEVVDIDGNVSPQDLQRGLQLAAKSEYTLVVLGEPNYAEKTGDLLESMALPAGQLWYLEELTKLNSTKGGQALADVIFGDVNPSARLPITYPARSTQLLPYFHRVNTRCQPYNECPVQWKFGHGLSYTRFEGVKSCFTVTNHGTLPGKEVVLLFVAQRFRRVSVPETKLLKAFKKLNELAPGASQDVEFVLTPEDWSYYEPHAVGRGFQRRSSPRRSYSRRAAVLLRRAPEYEKHLDKQYAAMVHASSERHLHNQKAHELLFGRINLRKHKSLGAWDIESGSSDDDGMGRCTRQRRHSQMRLPPASASSALDMVSEAGQLARKERNARRRKSESDALKQANIQRADMLRRRVLLRKLEEEIAGTVKANEEAQAAATSGNSNSAIANVRRLSNNALDLSDDRLKMLQEHPADCVEELTVLARAQSPTASTTLMDNATMTKGKIETVPDLHEVKRALKVLHDVLSFYLSVDHRDMNKLTVFCNSLLQHDGLNRLRAFEASRDQDVRALSNSIIEKAVPAIWH
ncbi:Glycoside hydrolase family 3 [Phytophthora cactorum]|nr:Glycoside hydrolase family 3 [Phytophthora cactorum]